MVTFQSFRTAINTLVFPEGQAETRVPLFRNFIVNGLIQLQTYVDSYQLVNVNFYDKDQSFDDCNTSVIQMCRGQIGAVYAFKPSCRCARLYYNPASLEKLSCLYDQCRCAASVSCCSPLTSMAVSAYTRNPAYCGDYVDGNTGCMPPYLAMEPEDDCQFKMAERVFAIGPNQKLWLHPRYPCGYLLAVHWRGIKRSYLDTDYSLDDDDLKDAIACYVEQQIAKRVDNDQVKAQQLLVDYRMKVGDIIYREENDLKPRAGRVCVEGLDQSELVQIYPSNLYPTEVGESCAPSGPAVSVPVMDLDIESESDNIIVDWEQATTPQTDEIWRSINGGAYAEAAAVSGSLDTYADASPMASGDKWCYKVRAVSGSVESDFSNEYCAVREMIFLGSGAVSQPTWRIAFGDFAADDPSNLTTVAFANLKRVTGTLYLDGCSILTSFNLASLVKVGVALNFSLSAMAAISLPSLTDIEAGDFEMGICPNLTTLSAPNLVNVNGDINADSSTNLVNVDLSSLILQNGRNYRFDNCALSAASVEHILARAIASGVTSATIVMDNGSSVGFAGISAQGQADYTALNSAGNSVDLNP